MTEVKHLQYVDYAYSELYICHNCALLQRLENRRGQWKWKHVSECFPFFNTWWNVHCCFKRCKRRDYKWLNAPDCTTNFQAADDKRTEGTSQWILSHPDYIKWKQAPNSLWIQGKAGSGKTILSTAIIRDLEQKAPENVWYHYFDSYDNTGQKSTFRGFLLSLLLRVGANSTGIHPALKNLFDKCNRQGLTGSSPTIKDLAMVLIEAFEAFARGYIVLDAMDECCESLKVLKWLQNLPRQLGILFTSRYSPEKTRIEEYLQISLDSTSTKIQEDIEIYLNEEMEKFDFQEDLKMEVINILMEKAQGQ
ncbi:hypothetical protein GYMLUDRAFT_878368 [Collybiopsis luxurians FD-317 M1]|uniref:Nephrocystin 3-like N-terminal domain-containing protein n=1 Tax=Collybiopsis luxurians FD-317 M1 TaxID=944289 RepID=A0A0D0AX65_9AGAR|nr:hypothetical protein GYMLUDRAFT_878368 [Collybiopsis luxurians FD-317 M1]